MLVTHVVADVQPHGLREEVGGPVRGGDAYLADVERRRAPYVARAEPRRRTMAYRRGLLSPAERKNSWQLAESSGEATPYAFQHLWRRARGDAEAVRDERRRSILAHRRAPAAVLVFDDTGVLHKGPHSAGVARQDSGTAGRGENGQIGVFMADASRPGQVLLDRALYLPKAWTEAPARCQQAGIPQDRRLATKPQLAQPLLARAVATGVPAAWVAGDRVYGDDRRRRMGVAAQPQADGRAVSGKAYVWLGWPHRRVKTLLATLPGEGWSRVRAGDGAQGPRWYDWCWLPLAAPLAPAWRRWLLVRRRVNDPTDLAAYVVYARQDTLRAAVVRVAGTRWAVESCCEAAQSAVGRDHEEVRSWTDGFRHLTLAMWAFALLAVLRAGVVAVEALHKSQPPRGPSSLAAFKASRGLGSH